jgi:hypothetical protein
VEALFCLVILDSYRFSLYNGVRKFFLLRLNSKWQQKKIRSNLKKNVEVCVYYVISTFKDIVHRNWGFKTSYTQSGPTLRPF